MKKSVKILLTVLLSVLAMSVSAKTYKLTITYSPAAASPYSEDQVMDVEEGTYVTAWANYNYQFVKWTDESGNTVSTDESFYYTMPGRDAKLTAVFAYRPDVPADPGVINATGDGVYNINCPLPGSLYQSISGLWNKLYQNGKNCDVEKVFVQGRINLSDVQNTVTYSTLKVFDISRTTGLEDLYAFYDHKNIEELYLPASLKIIDNNAFTNCQKLNSITLYAMVPPELGGYVESEVSANATDAVLYVPADAYELYKNDKAWSAKFKNIMALTDDPKLTVSLPEDASDKRYNGCTLMFEDKVSGEIRKFLVANRTQYMMYCKANTQWKVTLLKANRTISVLDNVSINNEDVNKQMPESKSTYTVTARVLDGKGADITNSTALTWYDDKNNPLGIRSNMSGCFEGDKFRIKVALPKSIALFHYAPEDVEYTVVNGTNSIDINLKEIEKCIFKGKVKALGTTTVNLVQNHWTEGLSMTHQTYTDDEGNYSITGYRMPSNKLYFSNSIYKEQETDEINAAGKDEVVVPDQILLFEDYTCLLNTQLTYKPCSGKRQNYFTDIHNIVFSARSNKNSEELSVLVNQLPTLAFTGNVSKGDVITLTLTSTNKAFKTITKNVVVGTEATFDLVELGQIEASFGTTENNSVTALLFDSKGNLVNRCDYKGTKLIISNLEDGDYTLLSMTTDKSYNAFNNLDDIVSSCLKEGNDYVRNNVSVSAGNIAKVYNPLIPVMNTTNEEYVSSGSSIRVDSPSLLIGNYQTVTVKFDLLPEVKAKATDITLSISLPSDVNYINSSCMYGKSVYNKVDYNKTLDISLSETGEDVKFCLNTTQTGTKDITAILKFMVDGQQISVPLSAISFESVPVSLMVPSRTNINLITLHGIAPALGMVYLYVDGEKIGDTVVDCAGNWFKQISLPDTYENRCYIISAKAVDSDGNVWESGASSCVYGNKQSCLQKVKMDVENMSSVDFDFTTLSTNRNFFYNRDNLGKLYSIYSFSVYFSDNKNVENVLLYVKCDDGTIEVLSPEYVESADCWYVSKDFGDTHAPVNLNVDYTSKVEPVLDSEAAKKSMTNLLDNYSALGTALKEYQETLAKAEPVPTDITDPDVLNDIKKANEILDEINSSFIGGTKIDEDGKINFELETDEYKYQFRLLDYDTFRNSGLKASKIIDIKDTNDGIVNYYVTDDGIYNVNITNKYVYFIGLQEKDTATSKAKSRRKGKSDDDTSIDYGSSAIDAAMNMMGVGVYKGSDLNSKLNSGASAVGNTLSAANALYEAGRLPTGLAWKMAGASEFLKKLGNVTGVVGYVTEVKTLYDKSSTAWEDIFTWKNLEDQIPVSCPGDEEKLAKIKAEYDSYNGPDGVVGRNSMAMGDYALAATANVLLSNIKKVPFVGQMIASATTGFAENNASALFDQTHELTEMRIKQITDQLRELECDKDEPDYPPFPFTGIFPIIDPSGYVYEAVPSNRVSGVTATIYYKEQTKDKDGNTTDNVVLWDAEKYGQENPLFTDDEGMYRWDVPQGDWKVMFNKDGYEPTETEWLPVPPPQLDINIGMTQLLQPEVTKVKASQEYVDITFSKYMVPSSLTPRNIYISVRKGEETTLVKDGTITLLDAEKTEDKSDEFASKVRYSFDPALTAGADEVLVVVSSLVKSYAGLNMEQTFSQAIDIQPTVTSLGLSEEYYVGRGQNETITITALPAEVAKNKTVHVTSSSELVMSMAQGSVASTSAAVTSLDVVLDAEGKATVSLGGVLPGATQLTFSIPEQDYTEKVSVSVVDASLLADIETPKASILNGSKVYRNQSVRFTCDSEGATIYYTTDGSCPCDAQKRIEYDGKPITITADVAFKVMAVGVGGKESEVAAFSYTINTGEQDLNLKEGWNWVSHNMSVPVSVDELQSSNVVRIQSKTDEMINDDVLGYVGTLTEMDPRCSYKVKASSTASKSLSGDLFNAAGSVITLKQGWNWIGYPMTQTLSLQNALATTAVEEGDYIISQDGFAEYTDNNWTGSITEMSPGKGYMYKSVSAKSLVYNTKVAAVQGAKAVTMEVVKGNGWKGDMYKYPNTMNIIAKVNGVSADCDDVTLGAFADNECRGVAKVVDGLFYITVYGNNDETVRFYLQQSGKIYEIQEHEDFVSDVLGSKGQPYNMSLGDATSVMIIDATTADGNDAIYNVNGIKQSTMKKGVNIIRMSNGSVKKEVVR